MKKRQTEDGWAQRQRIVFLVWLLRRKRCSRASKKNLEGFQHRRISNMTWNLRQTVLFWVFAGWNVTDVDQSKNEGRRDKPQTKKLEMRLCKISSYAPLERARSATWLHTANFGARFDWNSRWPDCRTFTSIFSRSTTYLLPPRSRQERSSRRHKSNQNLLSPEIDALISNRARKKKLSNDLLETWNVNESSSCDSRF